MNKRWLCLAFVGMLLPFVVDAVLITTFREQIGFSNYPSESFSRATDLIIKAGWVAVALMPSTFMPYACSVASEFNASWLLRLLALLCCFTAAAVVACGFIVFHSVIYSFSGGVK
jgi:hypothetical protein